MANKNFLIKNGLTVGGAEIVNSSGALTQSLITAVPSGAAASTQSVGNSSTAIATTAYVRGEIDALINSAPGTLNTLDELAAAINDDAAFNTTLTAAVALKSNLASPTFTGIPVLSNRLKTLDGSAQMNIGQWDGSNHRIEADSNRPLVITAYHSTGILLGTSGNTKLQVNGTGATVTGTLEVSGTTKLDGGTGYFRDGVGNSYSSGWDSNTDDHSTWINFEGYQGGTTRFRDLRIGTGKQASFVHFDGSAAAVNIAGTLAVTGATTFNNAVNVIQADDSYLRIEEADGTDIAYLGDHTGSGHGAMWLYNHGGTPTIKLTADSHINYINNGNNFGIGTTNPSKKLSVNGTMSAVAGTNDTGLTITGGTASQSYGKIHMSGAGTAVDIIRISNDGGHTLVGTDRNTGGGLAGSSLGYSSVFGSIGATAAHIMTNNSVKMTVESGGNVGIGTTDPSEVLHVNGAAKIDGNLYIATGSSTPYIVGGQVSTIFRNNANSASLVTILNGGNVGIGTATPAKLLHLLGSGDGTKIRITRSGLCEWDFSIGNTSTLSGVGAGALELLPLNANTANEFAIGLAGTTTPLFHLTNTQNYFAKKVGIGTTAPGHLLDLLTSSGNTVVNIKSTTGGDPELQFDSAASSRNGVIRFLDQGAAAGKIIYAHNGDTMSFHRANEGTASLILKGGKVAIGTTSPQKTLHVFQTEGGVGADHATIRLGGYSTTGCDIAAYRHDGNSNNQGLKFSTYDATNGSVEKLRIEPSGITKFLGKDGGSTHQWQFTNNGLGDASYTNCSVSIQGGNALIQLMAWGSNGARIGTRGGGWSGTADDVHLTAHDAACLVLKSNGVAYLADGSTSVTSDQRLKKNITSMANGQLANINALTVRNFEMKDDRKPGVRSGLIAQEVESVISEAVEETTFHPDPDDTSRDFEGDVKIVKYGDIQMRLLKAVQELSAELTAAKARITALEG